MAQKKILINNTEIWQPDQDMAWNHETTYTPDSTRVQSGEGHFTEMFTTESFGYSGSSIPISEVKKILQMIVGKKYNLYAFNPYFGKWMTMRCYTGQGSLNIGTLEENQERITSLTFNAVDIMPLEKQS